MIRRALDWVGSNHWRFSPMNLYEKFEQSRFDRRHGVETERDMRLADANIDSPNIRHGLRYHATPPVSFRRVLKRLNVDYSAYTFVDFGSGKGRTLLLASEFPFKKIIGVEFGRELHRQATENIAHYKPRHHAAGTPIEAVHADATQFALPDGPLILYFFNPFDDVILRQVVANIRQAATAAPRKIIIVYLYLENDAVFRESGQFASVFHWHRFNVYACLGAAHGNADALIAPLSGAVPASGSESRTEALTR